MTVTVEQLNVVLEAKIGKYNADLAQAQAATTRQLAAMEGKFASWSRNLRNSASTAAMGIGSALGGIGAYLGTSAVLEYANTWNRVARSLDATGQVFGIVLKPAEALNKLANEARVDLDAYAKLYQRTSAAIRDYGFEAGTAEVVTSTLSKALKLGGANAGEQASVLLQFSQALQKGKLDGDEFRSVMENAGVVQELLAKRLGVTKGQIIELAAAGKLQIRDLVGAMTDGADQVDRIFQQMPQTVDEAFVVLRNNMIEFIGNADRATGASQALASAIVTISQNLGTMAVVAGAILGSAAVRLVAFAAGAVTAANPVTLLAAAIGALATAYGVFGDDVKVSNDGIVTLKDSFAAFLDIAGGNATATLGNLRDVFQAMREQAAEWGLTWDNITSRAADAATALANKAVELDQRFGGYGAAIVNTFVAANKTLADTLGITAAINAALETGSAIAERAQQIAYQRGIEAKDLGKGLADYRAGKITDPRKAPGPSADPNAKRTDFEREAAQIRKRTAALEAELETIGKTTLVQERARAAAELRAAAEETARKQGRKVTEEEIAAIGVLSDKFAQASVQAELLKSIQSRKEGVETARSELSLLGLYGQELDAARAKLEMLNAAKRAGVQITPELERSIEATAQAEASVKAYGDAISDIKETSADALKGFVSDLQQGKSATDALAGALEKLGSKLLDAGIDQLINALVGGAAQPGGGLASFFGFAGGGVMVPGQGPRNLPRFARGGVSKSAAIFGEAGPEAAVPLPDGRRIPVDLRVPQAKSGGSQATQLTVAPVFNVQNGTPEGVEKMKSEIVPTIVKTVNEMLDRSPRLRKIGV